MCDGSSMLSIKTKTIVLMAAVTFAFPAFAGEGAEGGAKASEKKAPPSQAEEYVQKTTRMNAIQSRIDDAQKDFDKLVEEKDKEQDSKKKDELIKELVEVNKHRNKDVEDYNRTKQELLYQYPAKTEELNRLYQTQEKKEVDEMQSTADIDELLTRIKKVIQKKFAPLNPENNKPKPSGKDAKNTNENNSEAPAKLRLEK